MMNDVSLLTMGASYILTLSCLLFLIRWRESKADISMA